ncbi:translation initiation factor IF-2-like [Onychomys torridus]|uniref:translation initiation factor IF-2-like n=1 Tax=Onychomys torridus TaxID=38674 RepID=UPI00167F1F3D|nr:translation initiation factor IF-2-like [Onychomys torridus]
MLEDEKEADCPTPGPSRDCARRSVSVGRCKRRCGRTTAGLEGTRAPHREGRPPGSHPETRPPAPDALQPPAREQRRAGRQAGGAASDESSAPPPPPAGPALCLPLRRPDDLSREGSESRGPGPSPAPPLLLPGPGRRRRCRRRRGTPCPAAVVAVATQVDQGTRPPAAAPGKRVARARAGGRACAAAAAAAARPGACKQAGRLPGRSREETRQLLPLGGLLPEPAAGGEGLTRGGGGGRLCAAAGRGRDPRAGGAGHQRPRNFRGSPKRGRPLELTSPAVPTIWKLCRWAESEAPNSVVMPPVHSLFRL